MSEIIGRMVDAMLRVRFGAKAPEIMRDPEADPVARAKFQARIKEAENEMQAVLAAMRESGWRARIEAVPKEGG